METQPSLKCVRFSIMMVCYTAALLVEIAMFVGCKDPVDSPIEQVVPKYIEAMEWDLAGNLYAMTSEGLYLSTDAGDSWTGPSGPNELQQIAITSRNRLFLTQKGCNYYQSPFPGSGETGHQVTVRADLYYSDDFGRSFSLGVLYSAFKGTYITADASDDLYVTYFGNHPMVLHSSNLGVTWDTTRSQSSRDSISFFQYRSEQRRNDFALHVDRAHNLYFKTSRSSNRGLSWEQLPILGNLTQNNMVQGSDGTLWVAEKKQLMESTDYGVTWNSHPLPVDDNETVSCVACDPEGRLYLGTTTASILISTDKGLRWKRTILWESRSGNVAVLTVLHNGAVLAYCEISYPFKCGLFRSLSRGESWEAVL